MRENEPYIQQFQQFSKLRLVMTKQYGRELPLLTYQKIHFSVVYYQELST